MNRGGERLNVPSAYQILHDERFDRFSFVANMSIFPLSLLLSYMTQLSPLFVSDHCPERSISLMLEGAFGMCFLRSR